MKILMSFVVLAMIVLPGTANAAQCRDSGTGKFAKCGAPGAVPASEYVAKGKPKAKAAHVAAAPAAAPAPAATPAKPGLLAALKAKVAAKSAPAATKPAPAATKVARCKSAKGKFVKCGTPGAVPA